jgi:hypothetical protein
MTLNAVPYTRIAQSGLSELYLTNSIQLEGYRKSSAQPNHKHGNVSQMGNSRDIREDKVSMSQWYTTA